MTLDTMPLAPMTMTVATVTMDLGSRGPWLPPGHRELAAQSKPLVPGPWYLGT
jgi:hypothetical protein